jgi:hypothetical protein
VPCQASKEDAFFIYCHITETFDNTLKETTEVFTIERENAPYLNEGMNRACFFFPDGI